MTDGLLEPKIDPQVYGLAYGIWLVTSALSVMVFMAGREIVFRTYSRFFPWDVWRFQSGQGSFSLVNILVSLPLAVLVIAIVIGGFEYQHRNLGKPQAWWMLARTLAIEFGMLMLGLFI